MQDQETVVFVFFFCTQNVVRRRLHNKLTVFEHCRLKLKNSPVEENPLNQSFAEMLQLFALLFGSSQRKSYKVHRKRIFQSLREITLPFSFEKILKSLALSSRRKRDATLT